MQADRHEVLVPPEVVTTVGEPRRAGVVPARAANAGLAESHRSCQVRPGRSASQSSNSSTPRERGLWASVVGATNGAEHRRSNASARLTPVAGQDAGTGRGARSQDATRSRPCRCGRSVAGVFEDSDAHETGVPNRTARVSGR